MNTIDVMSNRAKILLSISMCVAFYTRIQTQKKTGNHNNKATVCHADAITKVFTAICFVCQRVLGCQSSSQLTQKNVKIFNSHENFEFDTYTNALRTFSSHSLPCSPHFIGGGHAAKNKTGSIRNC